MFVRFKKSSQPGIVRVQIVESFREGRRTSQKILRHVGIAHDEQEQRELERLALIEIERIASSRQSASIFGKEAAEVLVEEFDHRNPSKKFEIDKAVIDKTVFNGPEIVYKSIFDEIGLSGVIPGVSQKILHDVIAERIENPASKLAIAERRWEKDGENSCSEDAIYRMMDMLFKHGDQVKKIIRENTVKQEGKEIDVAFFDCTTLYFESFIPDELRTFGFSKDHKFNQTQVVLALATTSNGMPIDFELFPGKTAEVSTLLSCLNRWKKLFQIRALTFVADRGIFSVPNLAEIKNAGYDFVVAYPMKKLTKPMQSQVLDAFLNSGISEKSGQADRKTHHDIPLILHQDRKDVSTGKKFSVDVAGTLHIDYCKERASKDKSDRDRLVAKISEKLGTNSSDPKKLVSNAGYKKYIVSKKGEIKLDIKKVEEDSQWDGLHGIYTSLSLSPEEVRARYKRLWVIEQTFRISKSDLKIRPVFHWKPRRIHAHVLLCYISLAIVRTIELKLKNAGIHISFKKLNEALKKIGYCVITDPETQNKYKLPIQIKDETKTIIKALGLKTKTVASKF